MTFSDMAKAFAKDPSSVQEFLVDPGAVFERYAVEPEIVDAYRRRDGEAIANLVSAADIRRVEKATTGLVRVMMPWPWPWPFPPFPEDERTSKPRSARKTATTAKPRKKKSATSQGRRPRKKAR